MTLADPDAGRLPLSALLSHALVAFTIEFDNEAQLTDSTRVTAGPAAQALVSGGRIG